MEYEVHVFEIVKFEDKDTSVVCSYSDGGDTGWSVDSIPGTGPSADW